MSKGPLGIVLLHDISRHRCRPLEDELLGALLRIRLGAREIGEPMDEIERHVATLGPALPDDLFEAVEEHARWGLKGKTSFY